MQKLIESLQLLAADSGVQCAALPPFVACADELALIFDDELRFTRLDELPSAVRTALIDLDEMLTRMSDDRTLWTLEAVIGVHAWERVREQARTLLRALGEEPRAPQLFWLTFVS